MTASPDGYPFGFEWDEAKNRSNIDKHGIDFADALRIFDKPTLDRIDDRRDYGEIRINSVGDLGRLIIATVTHTSRDGTIRLISARAASSAERAAYRAFEQERRTPP